MLNLLRTILGAANHTIALKKEEKMRGIRV